MIEDLRVTASGRLASDRSPFAASDVGNVLRVDAGGGFRPACYIIQSVENGEAAVIALSAYADRDARDGVAVLGSGCGVASGGF